jgi:hypothetical protein
MGKLVKFMLYVFAFVGLLVSGGGGYIYATNSDLVNEFWAVKDEFRNVPAERKKEVFAELPARVKFENEVGKEMSELPAERQKELYEQLAKSRDNLFKSFKERITAEAKIVRETKDKQQAAKEIVSKLGNIDVSVDMSGGKKSSAPKVNHLAGVESANDKVVDALEAYGDAKQTSDSRKRVAAAVAVLKALDKLGDEIGKARKSALSSEESSRLSTTVRSAKQTLFDVKQTPGLGDDSTAKPLLESVPKKLSQ